MSKITEFRELALRSVKQAQDLLTNGGAENEANADKYLSEARSYEEKASKLEEMSAMEARMNAVDTSKRPVTESRAIETSSRSVSDEFRSFLRSGSEGAALRELRAQGVATGAAGGYTVPVDFYNELTVSLIKYCPLLDTDVTKVIETSGGNSLQFPLLNDTANRGYIIGEGTQQNTANSLAFSQVTLGAYTFTNDSVLVSYELLEDTAVDIQSTIIDQIGQRIGRAMGNAVTTGSGTGAPTGIVTSLNTANATLSTANSGVIGFDDVYTAYHSTEPAYRGNPKFAWQMSDSTLLALRKLKDQYGRYLLDANYQDATTPLHILGTKVVINQAMPSIAAGNMPIIIGDHNGFAIRKVNSMHMQRLVERYADYRQVGFIMFGRMDSNLLDVKALKGLKT